MNKIFIQLQLFDVKYLFSEKHIFRKQKRTTVYGCASLFSDSKLNQKMMTCYFRDTNKFSRYLTLRTSILKCGFPTKGIDLTRLVLFEVLQIPQLRGTSVYIILVDTTKKFEKYKWNYGVRNFSVVGYVGETSHMFSAQGISLLFLATIRIHNGAKDKTGQRGFHLESMEAVREPCATTNSWKRVPAY